MPDIAAKPHSALRISRICIPVQDNIIIVPTGLDVQVKMENILPRGFAI